MFTRWMGSGDEKHSVWSNEKYRRHLLRTVGKIYNQTNRMNRLYDSVSSDNSVADELDLLNALIRRAREDPGLFIKRKEN